jgi:hypothetical protein
MRPPYHIHYLRREDLDTAKWDACIHLIYGKSWYLDHMTGGGWDALVEGDYQVVMPLTWRRKWGVRYLYQPAFTQQLGMFAKDAIPPQLIDAFLQELIRRYKFAEIFLNCRNIYPGLKPFTNLILDLRTSYNELAAGYKQDLVNNLKKANRSPLQYTDDLDLFQTLSLFQQQYSSRMGHLTGQDYDRFKALCITLRKKEQLLLRGITDLSGQVLATALLPRDDHRLYLVQSSVTPAGRRTGANHFLLDRLIHEFAGQGQSLILDFEGSELPGIALFYRNFGSRNEPYYFYRHNRLPWPLNLFKK